MCISHVRGWQRKVVAAGAACEPPGMWVGLSAAKLEIFNFGRAGKWAIAIT